MTGKKALVILTNEAFLPQGGRGGGPHPRALTEPNGMPSESAGKYAPSSWTTPITTTFPKSPVASANFTDVHKQTGVDIMEVGYLWMCLAKENNFDLTFCSPRGGAISYDPASIKALERENSRMADEIWDEETLMSKLNHTYPCEWVRPEDYDMVIIPGSHGTMFDLPEHNEVAKCISRVYNNDGTVCAIGHGVAALLNVRCEETNHHHRGTATDYLLKGKRITCFSKEEEEKVRLEKFIPYHIDEKARERGAEVETGRPFEPKVVVDERLITAQSYPSIHEFIKAILKCAKNY